MIKERGREGVKEIRDKPLQNFRGGGGSEIAHYVREKYVISIIISHKFQYISCLFLQNNIQL